MTEFFIKTILTEELFGLRICESLEDKQIVNYLYEALLLDRLLYGEPISVPELRKLLRNKIINFEFIKLDGEVRPARGTTMMKYVPQKDHPKGIRPSSPKVATFYDLEKDAWRSVSKRSKEIVLKRDEKIGKPVVVVKDVEPGKEPIVKPEREPMVEPKPKPMPKPMPKPETKPEPEPRPEPKPWSWLKRKLAPSPVEEPEEDEVTTILIPWQYEIEGEAEPKEEPEEIIPEEPWEVELGTDEPDEEEVE